MSYVLRKRFIKVEEFVGGIMRNNKKSAVQKLLISNFLRGQL